MTIPRIAATALWRLFRRRDVCYQCGKRLERHNGPTTVNGMLFWFRGSKCPDDHIWLGDFEELNA